MAEVADSFVQRADVRALMKKVRITIDPDPGGGRDRGPTADGVVVTLQDGTRLERRFDLPRGHPRRPVGPEALWTKFADCTRGALREAEARRLFDLLQTLERLRSIAELPVIDGPVDKLRRT
jgi:2-methylcitrate dehydratase PrpD